MSIVKFNIVPDLQKIIVIYSTGGTEEIAYSNLFSYLSKYCLQEDVLETDLAITKELYTYKDKQYLSSKIDNSGAAVQITIGNDTGSTGTTGAFNVDGTNMMLKIDSGDAVFSFRNTFAGAFTIALFFPLAAGLLKVTTLNGIVIQEVFDNLATDAVINPTLPFTSYSVELA